MAALIYTSPDNIRPNRDRTNVLDVLDFIDMYKPICNNHRPFDTPLIEYFGEDLGNSIWHKQDYALLGNYLGEKKIWVVNKESDTEYTISAGIRISDQTNLVGYILTDIPYHRNDIGVLKVKIDLNEV